MGQMISQRSDGHLAQKKMRVLVLGLSCVGKATILSKLSLDKFVTTIPVIGLKIQTAQSKGFEFTSWNVGDQDWTRHIWNQYLHETEALIYVVDGGELELLEKSKVELFKILNEDELRNSVLLVLANKIYSSNVMSPAEIAERLSLSSIGNRKWHIQATCAKTGEGLYEGLKWIDDTLQKPGQSLLSECLQKNYPLLCSSKLRLN